MQKKVISSLNIILVRKLFVIIFTLVSHSFSFTSHSSSKLHFSSSLELFKESNNEDITRRRILVTPFVVVSSVCQASVSKALSDPKDIDLPNDAVRSYLQYRIPLQLSADYYMFDLKNSITDFDSWGEINSMFVSNNARGGATVSRMEREFVNPMRILTLSMPPDISDEMRDAQLDFERAMFKLSKLTSGVRKDIPIDLSPSLIKDAQGLWENGRKSYNVFLGTLNKATGLNELTLVAAAKSDYPRSERKYVQLKKKLKLCQNRGGPTLSQAWGQLMVSGYMQDSCGIPDLNAYFEQ